MSWGESVWPIKSHPGGHGDRISLMGPIEYEVVGGDSGAFSQRGVGTTGCALSLNMSPAGILVLMEWEPPVDQVLRVSVLAARRDASPLLFADVRWTRSLPLLRGQASYMVYFVGLRFLFP